MAKYGGDSQPALLTVDMVVELKNWIVLRLAHILNIIKMITTQFINF